MAVGRHARIPRRYRGRDIFHWLLATGELDCTVDDVPDARAARLAPSFPLSGARGGEQLDLRVLHEAGARITGRLQGFAGRHAVFADDLDAMVEDADRRMRRVLAKIDRHAEGERARTPLPAADTVQPISLPTPLRSLDLRAAAIGTVLWATGYRRAYPWLRVPALDPHGELVHDRGVTQVPGLYALGLRLQRKRKSHFIGGVGEDAAMLAELILAGRREPATPVLCAA